MLIISLIALVYFFIEKIKFLRIFAVFFMILNLIYYSAILSPKLNILSVNKKTKGGNSIFATGYYRNVKNVVNRVNTIYNDTILNRIYSNVGDAKAIGVELGAYLKPAKNWSNFIGTNIYNYKIDGEFDNRQINSRAIVYSINLKFFYVNFLEAYVSKVFSYENL